MKRLTSSLIALAFVASLPAAGLAQGTSAPAERPKAERSKKDRAAWSNTQGLHETGDIIGASIQNAEGKNIGKVDALLLDPKDGKVSHAVVSLGGLLGIGDEKVVVPYAALKMSAHEGGRRAKITMDQATLESAPKYVKATDRAPAASPPTSPRSSTTPPSLAGDASKDAKRDADSRQIGDRPPTDVKTDKK